MSSATKHAHQRPKTSDRPDQPDRGYLPVVVSLVIALLAMGCYWGVGRNDFVDYDDQVYITRNHHLDLGFTPQGLDWAFTTNTAENWHPLTWLSHMLDVRLFGRQPQWHHRVNLLLHALNAVFLFLILKQMTARFWPSAFVAALFAVHPLNVESVAWAAERKNVLSTLFLLLTIWAYARFARHRDWQWYVLVLALFSLGLMAKPMLVTLPAALLLLDYWPLERLHTSPMTRGRAANNRAGWGPLVIEKLPLMALSAVSCVITYLVQQDAQSGLDALPLDQRLSNAIVAYTTYLGRFIYPRNLAVLYPHPRGGVALWQVTLASIFLAGMTCLVLWYGRSRKYLPVGWFWYLGTLVPVIGLVQVGTHATADRYAYVPLIGIFIAVTWTVADVAVQRRWRMPVLAAAAVMCLAACFVLSLRQVRTWTSTGTLFANALRVNPENDAAHYHVANDLMAQGKRSEAIMHYRQALRMAPAEQDFAVSLANALNEDQKKDEALAVLDQFLKHSPGSLYVLNARGRYWADAGRYSRAIADFQAVLQAPPHPDNARVQSMAWVGLGVIAGRQEKKREALELLDKALKFDETNGEAYVIRGTLESDLGQTQNAMADFKQAMRYQPRAADARIRLARVLVKDHPDEAIQLLREVAQLQPTSMEAHFQLAQVLYFHGRTKEAIDEMTEAARLSPASNTSPANNLAWYLATTSHRQLADGPRAVQLAEQICKSSNNAHPEYLDTLAAAYAAAGRFDDALKTTDAALEIATREGKVELAAVLEQRKRLYAAGKPYRDSQH